MEPSILSSINLFSNSRILRKSFVIFHNTKNQTSRTGFSIRHGFISTSSYRYCSSLHFLIPLFPVLNQYLKNQEQSFLFHSLRKNTFHSSVAISEQVNGAIPHLGDSITDATLLEWSVSIGQNVQVGDIIAIIETDKVTIDVTSQVNGILVEKLANIGDTLQVGHSLYRIETDENVDKMCYHSKDSSQLRSTFSEFNKESSQVNSTSFPPLRIPSIKFLGKKGWLERHEQIVTTSFSSNTINLPQSQPLQLIQEKSFTSPTPIEYISIPRLEVDTTLYHNFDAEYGRLKISEREIESITMGGATELPYWEKSLEKC